MSQREVGLGEEGRFLKMYKMWEDCWTKLKLKQIHVSFNSRQKKIALVWFFLATNGRPRARPLQFCCVPSFNLCTTHSSDNKISILLRHLLKKKLILFLLYFFSNCTFFLCYYALRGAPYPVTCLFATFSSHRGHQWSNAGSKRRFTSEFTPAQN